MSPTGLESDASKRGCVKGENQELGCSNQPMAPQAFQKGFILPDD